MIDIIWLAFGDSFVGCFACAFPLTTLHFMNNASRVLLGWVRTPSATHEVAIDLLGNPLLEDLWTLENSRTSINTDFD